MSWDSPHQLLLKEVRQRRDEGCVIPVALERSIAAIDGARDAFDERVIGPLYDALMALPDDPELAAREPNELDAIRALRPSGPRDLHYEPTRDEATDRFHGAWTGRAVGCALGKPVELVGLAQDDSGKTIGRSIIRRYLDGRDDWPLEDYFSGRDVGDGIRLWCPDSWRENIRYMEPDDDIHYTLVGLAVVERHGPDFDWQDIGRYWLGHIPIFSICTAEAQAIENLQNKSTRPGYWACAVDPSYTRRHRNPYREWIGAQIRADGWAWICAGKPELAAEFAHRDASWTHERNGIYGEMMFAAMQAAAFVERDARAVIAIGLSEIPAACRLALAVKRAIGWVDAGLDLDACMTNVEEIFAGMSSVHTINNAVICCLALLFDGLGSRTSRGPRAVRTSVACGHDTDCNGATVGSIVGASLGRARFDDPLADKLNDTIRPAVAGFEQSSMRSLAERTFVQFERVNAWAAQRSITK